MKLSTMLLPTGEFILVASEVSLPQPSEQQLDDVKAATGAALVLFSEQPVQVEDALFDRNARRVETPEPPLVFDESWTLDPDALENLLGEIQPTEGDVNLTREYLNGSEFSPAGLVKTPRPPEGILTFDELAELGAALRDPAPEAWEPEVGDVVIVAGKTHHGSDKYVGRTGEIITSRIVPPGGSYAVRLENGLIIFFPRESITLFADEDGDL